MAAKKVLTEEEKKRIALLTPCKTRKELNNWIKYHLDMHLPDCTVSRYADSNPLDIIWEVYRICVLKQNPDKVKELLCVAGRGTGKCVSKYSILLTKNGPQYVQNIKQGDVVWTGWSWQPVVETFDEGIKAGVKVTTNVGKHRGSFDMTGSLKHRVQAVDDNSLIDWVFMKDLKPGQLIYKSSVSAFDINNLSEDFEKGWIVGVVTGDGCVSRAKNSNNISISGADFKQLRYYANLVNKYFHVKQHVKRTSKRSVTVGVSNKSFKKWYSSMVSGELCYHKKLISLEHTPNFLAGFIAGMMETDGSKDSITLANAELIQQISQILTIFGVHSKVNPRSRKPRYSKFIKNYINYALCEWKSKLPEYLMPLFSKRKAFVAHANSMNEQFRYPSVLIKPFAKYIKEKYKIANGYLSLGVGKKIHSHIKYSKDLWGDSAKGRERYVYGHKIDSFIELAKELNEQKWVERLTFIRNGYYERVNSIEFGDYYFHDLEVAVDHSYWSNGFISHNTLGMAIAELMIILHDKRDTVHVGAIMSQAKRCYDYQMKFLLNDKIKPVVDPPRVPQDQKILQKANMEKSHFQIGKELVTLEVLPCTLKAVNGPHVPLVVVDEIDTMSGEGLKAFKDINGMLDPKNGKATLRIGISTRKSRYGLMNMQIENAEKEGRHVRRWTAFEFTERCEDDRSGINPVELYVNQDAMEVITKEEYDKKDLKKQKDFFSNMFPGEGCATCPIAAICLGDAKKQTSKSPMLKPIDELIKKVRSEGADWALAQLMNLKPSVEGIIYKEFEEKIHVRTWNEMWKTLTGVDFPGECTHDLFVKKCHELGIPCYGGVDWGWTNPNTVVYVFVDKKENVYVVRTDGMTQISQPSWVHHMKTKYHHLYRCQLYFPDVADPGAIEEMKKAGLPVANNVDKQINTGIQGIKRLLRVPGQVEPKIFLARETCDPLIKEFQMYHFKVDAAGQITEDPETEYDHWLDALRYIVSMLFGKAAIILGGTGVSLSDARDITDNRGFYKRTPSPEEFAAANMIPFKTDEDTSKLGKISNKKDVDDDDGDPEGGVGGDGGFLWSFN